MKVYVDELPKDCIGCPCESEYYCNLLNEDIGFLKWGEVHQNCPLQSIADYTKQVRKKVCEEIKEKLRKQYPTVYANIGESLFCSDCWLKIKELNEILDQIQGE